VSDSTGTGSRRERLTASLATVERHEEGLRHRIEDGLAALNKSAMNGKGRPAVTVHSRAGSRTPTLLLSFPGRDPQDAYRFLAERGVNAPAGTFYALEASRRLGFGDRGALRVGLAPYTDDGDVDRLLTGLGEFLAS
jgi:selenocysteine lyase/cysteine desulfurase